MFSTSLSARRHRVATAAPSPARRPQATTGLHVLIVLTAGAYLPSTLYPGYQHTFGTDALTMTLVHAVFALVSAPALLLLSPMSDVFGARPILRAGIVTAALGSACFALAPGVEWLVAGRVAQGLALGASTGAAAALVSGGTGGTGLPRGAALTGRGSLIDGAVFAGIAFVAGTAFGAVGGGFLAQYAPAPYHLPFVLHLVLLATAWHRVSALAPANAATGQVRCWRPTLPRIPRGMRALFATAATVGFLAWTTAGLFLAIIPSLLARSGRPNMAVTGCILGAVLLCSALTQPLVRRLGARYAQLAGLGALLVSLSLLSLTAGRSTSLTLVAAVVAGAGHGLAYGGSAAAVDARAPAEQRGAITGALYLAFYLGCGLPAVAVGLLSLSFPLATATSLVTAVAAMLVLLTSAAVSEVDRAARVPKGETGHLIADPIRHDLSA